ncbi:MAG: NRDE family protein [Planctomycetota bacterium]|nr:NRDE family protein [Planctomycetota bacterium]
MCTLTILPGCDESGAEYCCRLAFNRDEEHTRPPEQPPTIEVFGNRRAILPRDPGGGGTWLAASDVGLAFALLNVNLPDKSTTLGGRSRGVVIPSLLSEDSMEAVVGMLPEVTREVLRPFRLVVTDGQRWLEAIGQSGEVSCSTHALSKPIMRSSSGLGDDIVEAPRRNLFDSMFKSDHRIQSSVQDAFHASRIPDHDEQSVDMLRDDARTVSTAVITLSGMEIVMEYTPGAPREQGVGIRHALVRTQVPGAA